MGLQSVATEYDHCSDITQDRRWESQSWLLMQSQLLDSKLSISERQETRET